MARRSGPAYLREQPFGQVPAYADGSVAMFESGAIVLRIAEASERLMPKDDFGRGRTMSWVFAALNSVEPAIQQLGQIDVFHKGEAWTAARRPQVEARVAERLDQLAAWLGGKDYLEADFSAGDLLLATVLRELQHTALIDERPILRDYLARCVARPAFGRAMAAQLADFEAADAERATA